MSFAYEPTFQVGPDTTEYRRLGAEGISTVDAAGRTFLNVEPRALKLLSKTAFHDLAFFLRARHLKLLKEELADPQASDNDRFVIHTLLQNAAVAAAGVLPGCQDTGTAVVLGKKGQQVLTEGDDAIPLSEGVYETYAENHLRYSQLAPLEMFKEKNTGTNLPAQVDLMAEPGGEYHFLFISKGGGSANKMYFYQSTPSVLNEKDLEAFIQSKLKEIGTSACPPYHLAVVVGGTSIDACVKTLKLATTGSLDTLPTTGSPGGRAFRDPEWEKRVLRLAQESRIGAQFGGKYFAHDARVIRLPRHAASCPIAIGVSCSADRQIKGKITRDGIFLEQLEFHPEKYLPAEAPKMSVAVPIDLNRGMDQIRKILTRLPVKTRLSLTGTLIVARDVAHARIRQMLEAGKPMPEYFKNFPIYYAGPAK